MGVVVRVVCVTSGRGGGARGRIEVAAAEVDEGGQVHHPHRRQPEVPGGPRGTEGSLCLLPRS